MLKARSSLHVRVCCVRAGLSIPQCLICDYNLNNSACGCQLTTNVPYVYFCSWLGNLKAKLEINWVNYQLFKSKRCFKMIFISAFRCLLEWCPKPAKHWLCFYCRISINSLCSAMTELPNYSHCIVPHTQNHCLWASDLEAPIYPRPSGVPHSVCGEGGVSVSGPDDQQTAEDDSQRLLEHPPSHKTHLQGACQELGAKCMWCSKKFFHKFNDL